MITDGFSVLYAAARWLGYLAAFLVVGSVAFARLVLPRAGSAAVVAPLDAKAARLAFLSAGLLVLVSLLRLYLQAKSLIDPGDAVTVTTLRDLLDLPWGKGWLAQLSSAVIAVIGARVGGAAGRALLGIGGLGIVLAAPLTGHAVGLPQAGRLGYPLDLLHFGLGATWLGSLAAMLIVGLTGGLRDLVPAKRLVAAFSPVALVAGVGAMGLGGLIAWRYLGGFEPFVTSIYGRTVLIKATALGGVALIGAYNWRVVGPRLERDQPAPVQTSSRVELLIGIVLLGITAVLVSLPLPGEG